MPSAVTHFYSGQPMHFYSGVDNSPSILEFDRYHLRRSFTALELSALDPVKWNYIVRKSASKQYQRLGFAQEASPQYGLTPLRPISSQNLHLVCPS